MSAVAGGGVVVSQHHHLCAAGRRRRDHQPAELLLCYPSHLLGGAGGQLEIHPAPVPSAGGAVPALFLPAGDWLDQLFPGRPGGVSSLHPGLDLRRYCAGGLAGGQGGPQRQGGGAVLLHAAHDVLPVAGLYRQQPVFLRSPGAERPAAGAAGGAVCAALAGYRPQALGGAGCLLHVPRLRHL